MRTLGRKELPSENTSTATLVTYNSGKLMSQRFARPATSTEPERPLHGLSSLIRPKGYLLTCRRPSIARLYVNSPSMIEYYRVLNGGTQVAAQ
eukprot:12259388-Heterocapsa_arctica.AAC.1